MCACACVRACVCVCVCVCVFPHKRFGRTVLYVSIEYCIQVNMYHVSARGVDERMVNVHLIYI